MTERKTKVISVLIATIMLVGVFAGAAVNTSAATPKTQTS